jgi:hypothetical protein
MLLLQEQSWFHRAEAHSTASDYVKVAVQLDVFDVAEEAQLLGSLKGKDRLAFSVTVDF